MNLQQATKSAYGQELPLQLYWRSLVEAEMTSI